MPSELRVMGCRVCDSRPGKSKTGSPGKSIRRRSVAKVSGSKGGAESTCGGDPFLRGKFLRSDNERRRDAENPVVARGYSRCEKTIRVDTIRKVAIIAVGGK